MKTIYIVTASSGDDWDSWIKWNVKAFPTKESAQAWIDTEPGIMQPDGEAVDSEFDGCEIEELELEE